MLNQQSLAYMMIIYIYIDILGVFPGSFSGGRGREEAGGGNGNVKIDSDRPSFDGLKPSPQTHPSYDSPTQHRPGEVAHFRSK